MVSVSESVAGGGYVTAYHVSLLQYQVISFDASEFSTTNLFVLVARFLIVFIYQLSELKVL